MVSKSMSDLPAITPPFSPRPSPCGINKILNYSKVKEILKVTRMEAFQCVTTWNSVLLLFKSMFRTVFSFTIVESLTRYAAIVQFVSIKPPVTETTLGS